MQQFLHLATTHSIENYVILNLITEDKITKCISSETILDMPQYPYEIEIKCFVH